MRAVEVNVSVNVGAGMMGEYVNELLNAGVTHIIIRTTEEFDDALAKRREESLARVQKEVDLINGG